MELVTHDIPPDLVDLKQMTRRFVEEVLRPHERLIEESDHFPEDLRRQLRRRAVETGLFAFNMPADVGGPGLSWLAQVLIREELGKVSVPLADVVTRPPRVLLACHDSQRTRFLYPAVHGEKTAAFALTEPDAGSDVGSMRTTATRWGEGYILNGVKRFISHGDDADFVVVFARVPQVERGSGITAFIVEKGTPGFRVGRIHPKMGWRGYTLAELVFEDCYVPETNRLGEEGSGLALALDQINEARLGVAAHSIGMAQRALDIALDHAVNRVQFGRPIGRFQGIQWMLAEMAARLESARALVYAVARSLDIGKGSRYAISTAKFVATETAGRVVDEALQILGGSGYVAEGPMEMIYRDVRAFRLGEGTSEIQKTQIARALLGKEATDST